MNIKRICPLASGPMIMGALLLSGCATYGNYEGAYDDEAFGEANRQTYAAMIVDPEPEYDEPLPTSAEMAAKAQERYLNDAVKEPESIRSTDGPN